MVIWKIPLEKLLVDQQGTVQLPVGAKILSVGADPMGLVLWVLCDPPVEMHEVPALVTWTGLNLSGDFSERDFIGTVQGTSLVWHVFVKGGKA